MLTDKIGNQSRLTLPVEKVGILYHPFRDKARILSNHLYEQLSSQGISVWQFSTQEEEKARVKCNGSHLILSIGGDGTLLRVARIVYPAGIPILGIKLGRLGFNTELGSDEIADKLSYVLEGKGWVEQRTMLEITLDKQSFHTLNDVVLRGSTPRLINIKACIDGAVLTTYRADGIILATSTGSTGYSLAAGGPVLNPQSREFVLKPICCHLGPNNALVLASNNVVELKLSRGDRGILILDGQIEIPLHEEQNIIIKLSSFVTSFLKLHPPEYFYQSLLQKLKLKGVQ